MIRYGFNIRTKTGQRVDNIQIMAATPRAMPSAGCGRCTCNAKSSNAASNRWPARSDSLDVEHVIGLISAASSVHKAGTH